MISVKILRQTVGMSQKEFSEYIGISLRRIQSWEQGYRCVDSDIVCLMIRVMRLEGKLPEDFSVTNEVKYGS